ncbi:hypothetical protein EJV47_24665 [Hymenobacter gummosus]|uniref:4-fold beta flower domain-containing protein n=1 Tax=Hymenobacter gummosus TaxID=1776032 RepID=A0A3S0IJJ9_9BACT|nr:hypothetical protein [Hymenobacter gummosus]RTQ45681.1 hypothetical protein EJV47_24665 [Hymenobacter gummosus]
MIPLYDYSGAPVAYADDLCLAVYLPDGTLAAWFDNGLLYTPQGRYLGWVDNGWVLDRTGHPALFADNASGRPLRPPVQAPSAALWPRPVRRAVRPPAKAARPARRGRKPDWSALSGPGYFQQ